MYKFEDHVDHYDDVFFKTLPAAFEYMNSMIQCAVEDISRSHYSIIDDTTGEVVEEYISNNYHLLTKDGLIKRLTSIAKSISNLVNYACLKEEIPSWATKDMREYANYLISVADAMDAVLPQEDDDEMYVH